MAHPCTKKIDLNPFSSHVYSRFAPVDLNGILRIKPERHEALSILPFGSQVINQIPDRRFVAGKVTFIYKSMIDAPCGVTLFLDVFPLIFIQTLIDKN